MDGISTSEAISYGLQHMVYMGVVYLLGFVVMGFGILLVQDSPGMAVIVALIGLAIILGGLHGAIYKMAGDATARVMSRSTATTQKVSSSESTSEPASDSSSTDRGSHPDPAISDE